jgi:dolichol-phosphate mannosyltransferase
MSSSPPADLVSLPSSRNLSLSRVSVIVPTYREVENIPLLVTRLNEVREKFSLDLEVLFMDDDSRDGSSELVEKLALPWVNLITRTTDRGLSYAVLDGLRRASGDVLLVMDADLSHPPEVIPDMLGKLRAGADFVVGSRFVNGGTTDDDWGLFRWLNSRVATLLALPLTSIKDPMSGFFMLKRDTFLSRDDYNPIGYKIGLELLVKCECRHPAEIPIHFTDRQHGQSKLSFKEQMRYVQHVRRLYIYRFGFFTQLIQFLFVGTTGLVVNLLTLTLLLSLGVSERAAIVVAIAVSILSNFLLNRRFSFSHARNQSFFGQLLGFVSASSLGALVNYAVTVSLLPRVGVPQIAATIGVVCATGLNFLASRYLVFRRKHVVNPNA